MEKLVSVILPNFNHAKYLQDRLNSIFNQTYQDFEIIILDDASTDSSLKILNKYQNHPKVSHFIVNKVNTGSPFKQWRKGLDLVKGDFIWIAETDDFCETNFLETQIEILNHADVAVAETKIFSNNTIGKTISHPVFRVSKDQEDILYCPILNVSSVLFKSSLLKDLSRSNFANYNIIGDTVFYFEFFKETSVLYNKLTINYFRRDISGVSDLDNRNMSYLNKFLNEHYKFISYAKRVDLSIKSQTVRLYIRKFYNRVSNRVPKKMKLKPSYFYLFMNFKLKMYLAGE